MTSDSQKASSNNVPSGNEKIERPKLKILAFHGFRQNGAVFRGKIGSFRKCVARYAQLVFITGPHVVKEIAEGESGDSKETNEDMRGWWFNAEDNSFSGKRLGGPAIGFEDTLKVVEKAVMENGPFDGFMGFSQGACLVGILAAMQQKGFLPYKFKFAIFASGFCSGSLVHKGFFDSEIKLPSLHVYGENDLIIPKEMSEALINSFEAPVVVEHPGGHYVACSGSIKDQYQDFLSDRLQDKLEEEELKNSVGVTITT